jgi:hypothetical protein
MSAPQWGHVAEWLRSGLQNQFFCPSTSLFVPNHLVSLAFMEAPGTSGAGLSPSVLLRWVPIAVPT